MSGDAREAKSAGEPNPLETFFRSTGDLLKNAGDGIGKALDDVGKALTPRKRQQPAAVRPCYPPGRVVDIAPKG